MIALATFCRRMVLPVRGGGDDQAALAETERADQVHRAHGDVALLAFEENAAIGKGWRKQVERGPDNSLGGLLALDLVDAGQGKIALLLFGARMGP